MPYLIFADQKSADDFSRQAWVQVLGRPKRPADVVEFLWRRLPGKDGRVAVDIPSDTAKWKVTPQKAALVTLTAQQTAALVPTLDPANWPTSKFSI